jgi:hypothetical protein
MPDTSSTTESQPSTKPPYFEFKEVVTAAIALAIVATLIGFLWNAFFSSNDKLGETQKYVIGIALSLAGTVTGYYFGRVPAEKHADTAVRAAEDAKKGQAQADAKVDDVKKTLDRILPEPPGPAPLDAVAEDAMPSSTAHQELMALRRRM